VVQGGNSTAQKFKTYQDQEINEDLGYNMHEFKYRHYDAAIGRFVTIDPLADEYTYNSTYAFQENKLGLGIELEGLELDRARGGGIDIISGTTNAIRESMNVSRQMDKRGFSGGERAEAATIVYIN